MVVGDILMREQERRRRAEKEERRHGTCSKCEGRGYLEESDEDYDSEGNIIWYGTKKITCPRCGGTGRI